MPNTILLKKSSTANAQPTTGQLAVGELAINTADGRLFAKNSAGTVVNLPVSSISGQTVTPGKVSATSNATDPTTFSASCRMLVYGDTFVGSSAAGVHTGVVAANVFDNAVDFAYMEALNCPPTQYKPLLFTTGYFPQLSLLPSRKIGVNTANPQADFQIVTGLDGIYDAELEEWNYPATTSALAGTAQAEIFQVINGGYVYDSNIDDYVQNEYVNLARFHCNSSYSRGSFSLSNSGTGAWENNVLQFFVHGSNYTHGYYGGNASDAGAAMIVTQGGDISKLQIGNLGSVPIEFFTNNAFRMVVGATGNVGVNNSTPASKLHVSYTITTNGSAAIAQFGAADSAGWANSAHQVVIGGPSLLNYTGAIIYSDTTTGTGIVSFADGPGEEDAWRGAIAYDHSADALSLWSNATERVHIDSAGNVGIGTNAPQVKLHVDGNASISGQLEVDPTGAGQINCMFLNAGPSIGGGVGSDSFFVNNYITNMNGGLGQIYFTDSGEYNSFLLDAESALVVYAYSGASPAPEGPGSLSEIFSTDRNGTINMWRASVTAGGIVSPGNRRYPGIQSPQTSLYLWQNFR